MEINSKVNITHLSSHANQQAGFTLIELVMVIVLIGILSIGAGSLFSSKDAYVDYLAKERLLSLGLLAQQIALGVSAKEVITPSSATPPVGDPAALTISKAAGGAIEYTLVKHQITVQTYQVDTPWPSYVIDGVALSAGNSVTLSWDMSANMKDATNHRVSIVGDQSFYVCFSSSGYVYQSQAVCP